MGMDDGASSVRGRRAMEFLHQARELRGLAPGAAERIERNIERSIERKATKHRPRPFVFAFAAAAMALVAGGAFALAHVGWRNLPVVGPWFAPPASHSPGVSPSQPTIVENPAKSAGDQPALRPEPAMPAPSADRAAPAPVAPTEPPAQPKNRRAGPARKSVALRAAAEDIASTSTAPSEAPVDPILAESQSFAAALERWHRAQDAAGALAALDAHDRRFPDGRLQVEARVLRAEILLSQGNERETLRLLDRISLAGSPRARELLTVRGELRVKLGRCADGRADLDEVLRKGADDGLASRAKQALEHCR